MKKSLSILLISTLILALCACGGNDTPPPESTDSQPGAAAGLYDDLDPVVLICANGSMPQAGGDLWGIAVCEYVEQLTGGKLTIDYYGNAVLGVDTETQTQMLAGDIDIVISQPGQTVPFVNSVGIFDLPFLFGRYDAKAIDYALNNSDFYDALDGKYAESNMVCLKFLQGATHHNTASNKPFTNMDEVKSLRIRTMDSQYHLLLWSSLGATPTPLPFSEVYLSLQQGLIDAYAVSYDTMISSTYYEVTQYLMPTQHYLYVNQFLMNRSRYESLPQAYQDALNEALDLATADIAAMLPQMDEDNLDLLLGHGLELVEMDPSFADNAYAAVQPVYDQIRSDIGDELVDLLLRCLDEA